MLPLFEALSGKPKALPWNEAMIKAFQDTKKTLADAALLAHPSHDAPISLIVDASDRAVGAVLYYLAKFVLYNGWTTTIEPCTPRLRD